MKIIQIHYSKKFNLGNYENHEIGMTAELDETDDPGAAMSSLVALVNGEHHLILAEQEAKAQEERDRKRKEFEERKAAAIAQMKANERIITDDEPEDTPF